MTKIEGQKTGAIDSKWFSWKTVVCVLTLASLFVVATGTAAAQTSSAPTCSSISYTGSGTSDSPYRITNVEQLQCVGENHADAVNRSDALDSNYELMSDINASGTSSWVEGSGFDPIGGNLDEFAGVFDGNGHTVSNLTISRSEDYVGLFGYIDNGGSVTNVALEDVQVSGYNGVGTLAGWNDGTVNKSYATGTIQATGIDAGGLIGVVNGNVTNSYANVSVSGSDNVGGLVGRVGAAGGGYVVTSYAVGNVTGVREEPIREEPILRETEGPGLLAESGDIGGLVGTSSGTVKDSYWDVNTTGQNSSSGGTGLKTTQLKGRSAVENMNFDFGGIWGVKTGDIVSYPFLLENTQKPVPGIERQDSTGGGDYNYPPNPEIKVEGTLIAGEGTVLNGSGSSDEDGTIEVYSWDVDGESSEKTGETVNQVFDESGLYEVELTVTDDGGKKETQERVLRVDEREKSSGNTTNESGNTKPNGQQTTGGGTDEIEGFETPSRNLHVGDEMVVEAADELGLQGNVTSYDWYVDGENVDSDEVLEYTLERNGTLNVTLSVGDDEGMNETFSRSISVDTAENQVQENGSVNRNETVNETTVNRSEDTSGSENSSEEDGQEQELPGFTSMIALMSIAAVIAYKTQ